MNIKSIFEEKKNEAKKTHTHKAIIFVIFVFFVNLLCAVLQNEKSFNLFKLSGYRHIQPHHKKRFMHFVALYLLSLHYTHKWLKCIMANDKWIED